jgi:type II secretory pathway component PulC
LRKKDVRVGDIILQVNQNEITSISQFKDILENLDRQKNIVFLISREKTTRFIAIKLD